MEVDFYNLLGDDGSDLAVFLGRLDRGAVERLGTAAARGKRRNGESA